MTPPAATPRPAAQPGVDLPQARPLTFEEYCAYDDGTDHRYEAVQCLMVQEQAQQIALDAEHVAQQQQLEQLKALIKTKGLDTQ